MQHYAAFHLGLDCLQKYLIICNVGVSRIQRVNFALCFSDHECDGGSYLAMDTQKCKECEPGTYSMGNTAKYEEWSSLPDGFTTAEQDISLGFVSAEGNCSE